MALFRSDTDSGTSDPPARTRQAGAANGATNPAEQHNLIGRSTVLQGTLRSSGNVNISGTVEGSVEAEGRTILMPGGVVEGQVVSTSAEIGGTVKGHVMIRERLVLKSTAVVEGDIRTAKLIVEDGAQFNGKCEMGAAAPSRGARPPDPQAGASPRAAAPSTP
jgi:cytoskeletal protein CcmA (bactofilin family)